MNELFSWKRNRSTLVLVAAVTAVICMVVLFFFRTGIFLTALSRLLSILKPFIWGAVIAYLLRPMCLAIERAASAVLKRFLKKEFPGVTRMFSIILSLVIMFAVITVLLITVLPEIISSLTRIVMQMPAYLETFQTWITGLDHGDISHEIITSIQQAVGTLSERLQEFLQTSVLPNLQTLISNVTSSFRDLLDVISSFGLGCIISSYLLGAWEKFIAQARLILYAVLPEDAARWTGREVRLADRMFSGFIHGKVLDSLIIGLICFVFTLIFRMPYAVLISVLVGVTNIIPFFGPYLGAVPSILLVLTVSPAKCIIFLIFIIVLQQFDGNILGPAILGDRLGISGIWILFSILFFSAMWGLPGMLVGVPLFAVIYSLIRDIVFSRLRGKGRGDMVNQYENAYGEEKRES